MTSTSTSTIRRWSRRVAASAGLVFAVGQAACQLLAGIDEKSGVGSTSPRDAAPTDGEQPDAGGGAECRVHADCAALRGDGFVCVMPEGRCQSLVSAECDVVLAGLRGASAADRRQILQDDETVFFGLITDLRGPNRDVGIARRQAVELAVSDIHGVTKGIPGGVGGRRRPIAVVACSETKDSSSPADVKTPSAHLLQDLHIPAIIGASNSDTTIDLFYSEAFPRGGLVFAPNAIASTLSSPSDNGLFWRTSTPAAVEAKAVQAQIAVVAEQIVLGGVPENTLRIAIDYVGNAAGKDLVTQIRSGLVFNGGSEGSGVNGPTCTSVPCASGSSKIFVREYGAGADPELLATELGFFAPHIVVAVGGTDAVRLAAAYEAKAPSFAPTYLITQGAAGSDVTTILTSSNGNGIRSRVRGTRPLASKEERQVFAPQYEAAFPAGPPSASGVPGSYDITFLLAYAAIAAPSELGARLTGARLASNLKRVVDRSATDSVKVGPTDLVRGADSLAAGRTLDVRGYSYTTPFDLALGETLGPMDVWCVPENANALRSSGAVFEPSSGGGALVGTYACPSN